jgi:HlyD family secretion protein
MFTRYVIPLLAVLGLAFAVRSVVRGAQVLPAAPPVALPPQAPFDAYVSAAGIVEPSSEFIALSTPVAGVAQDVQARVGMRVARGAPLFTIESRDLEAQRLVRASELRASEQELERLRALPRVELVRVEEARVREAESLLADAQNQHALSAALSDARALSQDERDRRRFAAQSAAARLEEARAALALESAGAWSADLAVAQARIELARAALAALELELERRTVRAPLDAQVLQVNLRAGEYAAAGPLSRPLIVLGETSTLHVRVDIDENDAWRFEAGAEAIAFLRGRRERHTALQPVRVEPYVVPKRSLTGDSTERVDTRVLQVLYAFEPAQLGAYVGQQVDVFIRAQPVDAHAARGAAAIEEER